MVSVRTKGREKELGLAICGYAHKKPSRLNVSKLTIIPFRRSISLLEAGKYLETEHSKPRVAVFGWNAMFHKSLSVSLTELVKVSEIKELEVIEQHAGDISISYINQDATEKLLGEKGKRVLSEALVVITSTAKKFKWPLSNIEITFASDVEVENWDYILLTLSFDTDFDTADRCLHLLYTELDKYTLSLTQDEREILQRLVYFDVKTTTLVSSS